MKKKKKGNDNKQNNDKIMAIISAIIAAIILYSLCGLLFQNNDENIREKLEKEYTYSQFMQDLEDDKVSKIAGIANSKTMDIVLKTEEQIAKENEIRKEHENNKPETKKALEKYNIDLEEARRKKAKEELKNNNSAKSLKAELKKVTWPTAEELAKSTTAVLVIILVVALIIFLSDSLFGYGSKKLTNKVIETKQIEEKKEEKKEEEKQEEKTAEKAEENKDEAKEENKENAENQEQNKEQ